MCISFFIKLVDIYVLVYVLPNVGLTQCPCHLYDDTADHCHYNVTTSAYSCTANAVTTALANRAKWWQKKWENFMVKWWIMKYIQRDTFSKVAQQKGIYIFYDPHPPKYLSDWAFWRCSFKTYSSHSESQYCKYHNICKDNYMYITTPLILTEPLGTLYPFSDDQGFGWQDIRPPNANPLKKYIYICILVYYIPACLGEWN